jgi:hypothetical protein
LEDIQNKILNALNSYRTRIFPSDVTEKAKGLVNIITKCQSISKEMGLSEICKRCDTEEKGSCCGRGIENYYDEPLLLLNLILGVNLHIRRYDKASCFFLGPKGCLLAARHTLCVNYLCDKITKRFSPAELSRLRDAEGIQLELTFQLCESLRKFL